MVAIEKMLRARIIQEKEGLAVAEAEVNRLGAVPMLEPQLAAIDDHKRLQTLLDSEMHKMDILDEERYFLAPLSQPPSLHTHRRFRSIMKLSLYMFSLVSIDLSLARQHHIACCGSLV